VVDVVEMEVYVVVVDVVVSLVEMDVRVVVVVV
jgi:hypothetical protein